MAILQESLTELVRDLRRGTQRLKSSISERRTAMNMAPINDRRGDGGYVSRPIPTSYEWIITAESGPLCGMRYAVAGPVMVGKAQECDLTLMSSQVSLYHTRLTLERYALYVEDMGSDAGTSLNGRPIVGRLPLHHGDVIQIQNSQFRVTSGFYRNVGSGTQAQAGAEQPRLA